ncbi:MAG: hypothetical protein RIC03_04475 [Cyclobacteriaceae bacterium]
MKNKRLIIILVAVAIVLCIPLIAMQFTDEVYWTTFDFVVMGSLLFGVSLLSEFAIRKLRSKKSKVAVIGIILLAFLLVWAELAVGIVGTPFAGS